MVAEVVFVFAVPTSSASSAFSTSSSSLSSSIFMRKRLSLVRVKSLGNCRDQATASSRPLDVIGSAVGGVSVRNSWMMLRKGTL